MQIEFLGDGRLLGALHSAVRPSARGTAVLLCNPFGEEASRAHRTYRVLATQLARAGFTALRFDYSGTGDSIGGSDDATIEQWLADIAIAAKWLEDVSRASRIALVGVRFGATLAMLAAARVRPRHVVMWDPVVDGAAYLRDLVAQHRTYMRAELGAAWRDGLQVRADGSPAEALGMPISDALAAGLAGIDLTAATVTESVSVVLTRETPESTRLRTRLPAAHWMNVGESAAWNSDAALNAMVVPMEIVQALVARIEESCP